MGPRRSSIVLLVLVSAGAQNTTLVTFVDCGSVRRMEAPLKNKACYARRHGYRYEVKVLQNNHRLMASGITYQKPVVLKEGLERAVDGELVVWLDADIVVMDGQRKFEEFVNDRAEVWITDHNCNPNNGAVALRNGLVAKKFIRDWIRTCRIGQFPFTDQGAFYAQLLTTAGNASLVDECHFLLKNKPKTGPPLMRCVMDVWDRIFGSFSGTQDRLAGPVGLRRASDGFNNHFCHPHRHVHQYCRWYNPPGWARQVCFRRGGFALHGRSPARSKTMGVPAANYDTAASKDTLLRPCVRQAGLLAPLLSACRAHHDAWVNIGSGPTTTTTTAATSTSDFLLSDTTTAVAPPSSSSSSSSSEKPAIKEEERPRNKQDKEENNNGRQHRHAVVKNVLLIPS